MFFWLKRGNSRNICFYCFNAPVRRRVSRLEKKLGGIRTGELELRQNNKGLIQTSTCERVNSPSEKVLSTCCCFHSELWRESRDWNSKAVIRFLSRQRRGGLRFLCHLRLFPLCLSCPILIWYCVSYYILFYYILRNQLFFLMRERVDLKWREYGEEVEGVEVR